MTKAYFTEFKSDTNWIKGVVDEFLFEAKVYDESSTHGINDGRVSKLSIWSEQKRKESGSFFKSCFLHYDRGWDFPEEISNLTSHQLECFEAVMKLCEDSPKRFENE